MGIRCADHVTPLYPQKLARTSPTGGGHSVGIVRSRTKATELVKHKVVMHVKMIYWFRYDSKYWYIVKGKANPLQTLTGPEGSRRLRFADFMTIGTWKW